MPKHKNHWRKFYMGEFIPFSRRIKPYYLVAEIAERLVSDSEAKKDLTAPILELSRALSKLI